MGLINLFISKKLSKEKKTEIPLEPSSMGRVLKEISEVGLSHTETEILKNLYKTVLVIPEQKNRLEIILYLKKLILDVPLTPVINPMETGEFISHSKTNFQSSRCKSLWSIDGGKNWYDVDGYIPLKYKIYRWIHKNIFRLSQKTPAFITSRMIPYVNFPYIKNIE